MKKSLSSIIKTGIILSLALSPFLALAAPQYPAGVGAPSGYQNLEDYVDLLDAVANWLFYIILVVSVIMLLWSAFTYLTADGDEEKIKKAKSIILYGLIALVIAFVANGIPTLVERFLGV